MFWFICFSFYYFLRVHTRTYTCRTKASNHVCVRMHVYVHIRVVCLFNCTSSYVLIYMYMITSRALNAFLISYTQFLCKLPLITSDFFFWEGSCFVAAVGTKVSPCWPRTGNIAQANLKLCSNPGLLPLPAGC